LKVPEGKLLDIEHGIRWGEWTLRGKILPNPTVDNIVAVTGFGRGRLPTSTTAKTSCSATPS
jgi:hypothetical protein